MDGYKSGKSTRWNVNEQCKHYCKLEKPDTKGLMIPLT